MNAGALLKQAQSAAASAARLLCDAFINDAGVRSHDGRDIKTEADLQAESLIKQELAASGIPIIAEESADHSPVSDGGLRWLVDPLDGTMNFSRGFPQCAVSIGLLDGLNPVLGVVYDLCSGVCYQGIVGDRAWSCAHDCSTIKPLYVSSTAELQQAILASGFPVARSYDQHTLQRFIQQVQRFKKIRMIGSAAMSLAMVARGTFDAYVEEDIMLWDVAAGLALVLAAGGKVRIEPGHRRFTVHATATNGHLPFPASEPLKQEIS